jgi:hypothetical protein
MGPGARVEAFLALLYSDESKLADFLADPRSAAIRGGVSEEDAERLEAVDRTGLLLAARSFGAKRAHRAAGGRDQGRPRR